MADPFRDIDEFTDPRGRFGRQPSDIPGGGYGARERKEKPLTEEDVATAKRRALKYREELLKAQKLRRQAQTLISNAMMQAGKLNRQADEFEKERKGTITTSLSNVERFARRAEKDIAQRAAAKATAKKEKTSARRLAWARFLIKMGLNEGAAMSLMGIGEEKKPEIAEK